MGVKLSGSFKKFTGTTIGRPPQWWDESAMFALDSSGGSSNGQSILGNVNRAYNENTITPTSTATYSTDQTRSDDTAIKLAGTLGLDFTWQNAFNLSTFGPWSFEGWFWITGDTNVLQSDGASSSMRFKAETDTLEMFIDSTSPNVSSGFIGSHTNQWVHLAFSYNSGFKIFRNGTQVASNSFTLHSTSHVTFNIRSAYIDRLQWTSTPRTSNFTPDY